MNRNTFSNHKISKMRIISTVILMILFAACTQKQASFTVSNTSGIDLKNKSLVIKRSRIEAVYGNLQNQSIVFLVDDKGNKIPAQLDDTRGDGVWDELFTQIDIEAGQSRTFMFDWDANTDSVEQKTNIYFADITNTNVNLKNANRLQDIDSLKTQNTYCFEGPVWGNKLVAFRNYFDARNRFAMLNKDAHKIIFTDKLKVDDQTKNGIENIIDAGKTLGAGGIALISSDKIYEIGPGANGTYKLITQGPLRSVFEFQFDRINIAGRLISVNQQITIEAGNPYYFSRVYVDDAGDAKLVAGFNRLGSPDVYVIPEKGISYFYSYSNNTVNENNLGMAIIAPGKDNLEVFTLSDENEHITNSYYTIFDISSRIDFYFMAGSGLHDEVYSTYEGFEQKLHNEAMQLKVDVDVEI